MILIISALFPPEPIVSASLSHDIVTDLAKDNKVVVLRPRPTRPCGFSYRDSIEVEKHYEEIISSSYVCPESKLFGRMYESYSFGRYCQRYVNVNWRKISCIYINSWPIFSQALIVNAAKKYHIPCIVHIQDIYPESLINKIEWNLIARFVKFIVLPVDKYILTNSTHILAISNNMKTHLSYTRGISENKITIVENWQNEDEFVTYAEAHIEKRDKNILTFMYLGNIGPVAGVDLLIEAFSQTQLKNSRLIIAGTGSSKQICMEIAKKKLGCIIEFWDVPNGKVPEVQSKADIMLLSVRKGAAMSSIPSKLPAYMFSKKAIIASLDNESDTAKVINDAECGIVVAPENIDALAYAMQQVAKNWGRDVLEQKGENGFEYAIKHFSKQHNLQLVTKLIKKYVFKN